jgi:hypothetical protein
MTRVAATLWADIRANWKTMVVHGLVFALMFQVIMLLALIVRFQDLPNYVTFYDWFGSAAHIIQSTPSMRDAAHIIWEEWLIEIGFMNYDYGMGISEWSLNVLPSRLFMLFVLGATVSLCLALVRRDNCDAGTSTAMRATTGVGALLVAMTNATMSWVVCCATPSWVVGLAMLGLGVSTSLALETMGPVLTSLGSGTLAFLIVILAARKAYPPKETEPKGAPADA